MLPFLPQLENGTNPPSLGVATLPFWFAILPQWENRRGWAGLGK
jgi:hypothetical protein